MPEPTTKILLVDDEQDVLMLISFYLQRAGYQVVLAESGSEALEKARKEKPAIVILDRMMPGMDGTDVCRNLRQLDPNVFVIMLTALGGDDDRILGLEAGADDYIVKPVNPRELILRISALLRRGRNQNETAAASPAPTPEKFTPGSTQPSAQAPSPAGNLAPQPASSPRLIQPNGNNSQPPAQSAQPAGPPAAKSVIRPASPDNPDTAPLPSNPASEETRTANPTPVQAAGSPAPAKAGQNNVQATINRNVEAILTSANQAAQTRDLTSAKEMYQHALKLDASNEIALMWLAWHTEDPYEAARYLERLVAAHPENAKAQEFLEAARRRIRELNALISDSNVLSYWTMAEQIQNDRIHNRIDRRTTPVQPVGQLLLRKGFITPEQLETAVSLHEMFTRLGTPKKLGEVLLEYGYLTKEQLRVVLTEQQAEYNSQFY